jgi:AraC family transcriptional regulator of arabinose operon
MTLLASTASPAGTRIDVIVEAKEYLHDHMHQRVTVEEMAPMASMSSSHLAALFHRNVAFPYVHGH